MAISRCGFILALLLVAGLFAGSPVYAQQGALPFSTDQWAFDSSKGTILTYQGRQSLRLSTTPATLKDVVFRDGIIEVDVSMPDERGFAYIQFRKHDEQNGEVVYLRMHKSGSPDAIQYAPRYNGVTAWQLYHGEGYTAPATFSKDAWTRFKIEVRGSEARVFVGEAETPAMVVSDLKRGGEPGSIGLLATVSEGIYFSNFSYTPFEAAAAMVPAQAAPPAVLSRWFLSKAYTADQVDLEAYPAAQHAETAWEPVQSEASGLVNISKYQSRAGRPSIVLARTTIRATADQLRALHFGYSDDVTVYLNKKPVFAGINGFRSRYPLHQGFVTADDVVYLDLKAGDNELLFVVSEVFGGWGFLARLDDALAGAP